MATAGQGLGPGVVGAGRGRRALAAGAAGVAVLTGMNEAARRVWGPAPRIERLGSRAVGQLGARAGVYLEPRERFWIALAATVVADGAFFAAAGLPSRWNRRTGLVLGTLAGVGAVLLPGVLGLGTGPTRRTAWTAWATVAWYGLAGLAAGAAARRVLPVEPDWTF